MPTQDLPAGPDGAALPRNRLGGETSPYLLQHAHNPVAWQPWGADALELARSLDRPIFLSVGYAACHWCHVMERESFEDAATALDLNGAFVAIKVDREERPDIDAIYMAAVQAMTGSGGWPMSVFLTPDGRPFYGGTYFPNARRHGMPAFRDVLAAVSRAWREQRPEIERSASELAAGVATRLRAPGPTAEEGPGAMVAADGVLRPDAHAAPSTHVGPATHPGLATQPAGRAPGLRIVGLRRSTLGRGPLDAAVATLAREYDPVNGGWGGAPKFPQPMTIEFLLRRHRATGDHQALAMARRTLDAMADGGIHDQLGGGFHRYATDAVWLVPHFEKMLYDNAQLARIYLHAHRLTGHARYLDVGVGTLDYLAREMVAPDGGFAASQDADTGGIEGGTFTWSATEVSSALEGAGLGGAFELFAAAYGVTAAGNWEGRTILARGPDDATLGERHGVTRAEVAKLLAACRAALLVARAARPQPARDDKVLAAWNGLAIRAFAEAGAALDRPDYLDVAARASTAVLAGLRGPGGRLRRSLRDGRATADGVLEDYAHLAAGLLALYEATFDEGWFNVARELLDVVLARFADPAGGFFDTAEDHEALIARPHELQDNALPSGNAMACTTLLRLSSLTGEGRSRDAAERALVTVAPHLGRFPGAFAQWLVALDQAVEPGPEIAIVGDPSAADTRALLAAVTAGYRPHQVLAVTSDPASSSIELLQSRFALGGRATAFVCRDFACRQPVTEPLALAAQLHEHARPSIDG